MSQKDLLLEYFKKNSKRNIAHAEIVDWASEEWEKRTGKKFRDPDRGIRNLHQNGILMKVTKGVYKYDPSVSSFRKQEYFSQKQKDKILKRDKYSCVICGLGKKDGVELHVDHIKPQDRGGEAILENGQILCSAHNNFKKNYKQTETGKRMFIRLHKVAKKSKDKKLTSFCLDILKCYTDHDINGHIEWEK